MDRVARRSDDVHVTDSSGLRGNWLVVLAGAVAVLTAAFVTLVVRTGDPTTADTYLESSRDAAVVLADGRLVEARDGMRVPSGATVRTGAAGAAHLSTAGRDVYLGALTTLIVLDGLRETLDRGQVMADSRNGPRLQLTTRAGLVTVAAESLARVENGPVLRLGVFTGSSRIEAVGRQASTTVPALYQVQAPYGGLPGAPTALALTDDAWEQRLAGALVGADRDLDALERGLAGADGLAVLSAAPVALREVPPTSPDRGEQALSVAVAQAAQRSSSAAQNLTTIQTDRGQGGSWGVVAAIVQARVSAVSALLDGVLSPPGTVVPVLAGATPLLPGLFGPSQPTSEPSPTGGPSGSPVPSRSPSPRPTPTRTVSPSPSAVDQVISTVTGLLATPSPSATTTALLPSPVLNLPLPILP